MPPLSSPEEHPKQQRGLWLPAFHAVCKGKWGRCADCTNPGFQQTSLSQDTTELVKKKEEVAQAAPIPSESLEFLIAGGLPDQYTADWCSSTTSGEEVRGGHQQEVGRDQTPADRGELCKGEVGEGKRGWNLEPVPGIEESDGSRGWARKLSIAEQCEDGISRMCSQLSAVRRMALSEIRSRSPRVALTSSVSVCVAVDASQVGVEGLRDPDEHSASQPSRLQLI